MNPHGLMNLLISFCFIGDVREQVFQARSNSEAFFVSNLRVDWFLLEQGLRLFHESIAP